MSDFKIYHNPRCRKSREGLQILLDNGIKPEIIEYLKNPPSAGEMALILKMLNKEPLEIIRKNEIIFKEKYKGKELNRDEWINVMINNPILIERPIVVTDKKAVLGRPSSVIKELIWYSCICQFSTKGF